MQKVRPLAISHVKMLAAVLVLLVLACAGCSHSASGRIGVEGMFRFQLIYNRGPFERQETLAQGRVPAVDKKTGKLPATVNIWVTPKSKAGPLS